jgi:ADP-heptose:LPS heptosyltransferase
MKYERTLIAGPWVGEFGWELFAWQGYVRSLSRNFDKTIIISRKNSKALYDDFCSEFIPFEPPDNLADSFFMYKFNSNEALKKVIRQNKINLDKFTTVFAPRRIGDPPRTHYSHEISFGPYNVRPEYIQFGQEVGEEYDYVFHIRNRELRKEDNWSIDNWISLLKLLGTSRVACIGTLKESAIIDGVDDLRGRDLSTVFDTLRSAKCAFGPSSGPMHLASLCGCPHVVWSREENFTRYTTNWNPLSTPVLFDPTYSWHPSPKYVYDKFKEWSSKWIE